MIALIAFIMIKYPLFGLPKSLLGFTCFICPEKSSALFPPHSQTVASQRDHRLRIGTSLWNQNNGKYFPAVEKGSVL